MALFGNGEFTEELAHADVGGLLRRFRIETRGLKLHRFGLSAYLVERQIPGQPNRPTLQKTFHILASNWRQDFSKALLVHGEEVGAVIVLLCRHLLENLGRIRVALGK